ncbi:FAD-dependent oxidoreductase [Pantoea sp. Aalb]|uniref:FAD-dependent oxidoreductase n=1 Tax=Pantoea sp. Aalb TaxID=2576762 RepID=UPI001327F5E3|nr:FAD-dependent oxidoreductase [Pantoea sp. Aalb]MXP67991.1 FAD-dependent oxidoreductase [Pantoea sp. Aalb]
MSRWTVLGCGVVGLCVATVLAENGKEVEVINKDNCQPASWFAGGMLAPWCESESAPQDVLLMGQYAATWWQKRVSSVKKNGTLVIASPRDHQELNRFARMTTKHQWITPSEVEPELEQRFARGLFFPMEAHLDPRLTLMEIHKKLLEYGVLFNICHPNSHIIDCRGIHASHKLPLLRAVRGEMIILHSKEIHFSRPIRLLHPRFPCYLVPRENGYFMLGATMIESNDASNISARAMMELLSAAYSIHPALAEARIIESSSGLRPAYPNNLPKIYYQNNTFYLNGMYRHGFLLAPMMAEKLMQRLLIKEKNV